MAQDDFVAAAEASGWIVYAESKENDLEFEGKAVVGLF
jgi:hypothetical protein